MDQYGNIAIVSVFFDLGSDDSEFLQRIGMDPNGNSDTADLLQGLSSGEQLYLDYTVVDLKSVRYRN